MNKRPPIINHLNRATTGHLGRTLRPHLAIRQTPGGLFCAIGNPLNDGTWTYSWSNGRQLTRMTSVDKDVRFVYNENGLRVQKRVDGVATNYYLHGKNVVHMTRGSDELHFFYDAQNKPAVVVYNGTAYAYLKNLQGDIVAILNGSGSAVVTYVYDAWGRPVSKTGSMASTLGTLNPFRYRSYVYDEETGLYYLRSRYYNPMVGRFICPDVTTDQHSPLLSHNLFTYCLNAPTMRTDAEGMSSDWFAAVVTVAVAVVTAAAVIAAAPVIASAAGTTALIMGASSVTISAVSTAANFACVAVAGSTVLCGVNQSVEIVTGTNCGEYLFGEAGYSFIEDITYTAAAMISMAPNYLPYPSTGRTEPANLKEQMKYRYAIEDGTKGKVIIPYLNDSRMPGWLGWQKYSIAGDGVDIHYVGHRFLPVRFDYKIK